MFTHDDRLPEALRRLQLPATILNVTRRPGSIVEVEKSLDPIQQALQDARALALSDSVPEDARRRLVPGFCRTALEAAATAVVQRRRLTRGDSHADVEDELRNAHRLTHYLAMALFDDRDRGGDVLPKLNQYGRSAGDAFQACNKGVHQGYPGDLIKLVQDTTSLAARIEILAVKESQRFVGWAEALMQDPAATSSGTWPRAAALLGRSSLEAAMTELWDAKDVRLEHASWRAQLLCLPGYIDPDLARRVAFAHSALSAACHHHPYDLPPDRHRDSSAGSPSFNR